MGRELLLVGAQAEPLSQSIDLLVGPGRPRLSGLRLVPPSLPLLVLIVRPRIRLIRVPSVSTPVVPSPPLEGPAGELAVWVLGQDVINSYF